MKKALYFVFSLLVLTALACGFSASTANIGEAKMARDPEGNDPTTIFAQDDNFYAVIDLANAPDDTKVKAVWIAIEADGVDSNLTIDEVELVSAGGQLHFELSNDKQWPTGSYKVDLLLNDELDRSLEFTVEGDAVAEEPEPTDTPEPTNTPEPEPTNTAQSSAGDSLGGSAGDSLESSASDEEATDSSSSADEEPIVLPFEEELYVHPSGAVSFAVPKGWESIGEDELSGAFGDDLSRVGAIFINSGTVLDEEEMLEFINTSLEIVIDSFADDYEVVAENNLLEEDDLYFVSVSFSEGDGQADFFFDRRDNIIFVLYFASFLYDEMEPTWDAIIDSYQLDLDAALAATPDEAPTPTPPSPPPTATPAPPSNPYVPPSGVARVYLENRYSSEYNIDFGDGSGSIHVPPGAQNFFHDLPPGSYNPGLSLPGGGATNVQFEIAANQAWIIIVTEELQVRGGQVYP